MVPFSPAIDGFHLPVGFSFRYPSRSHGSVQRGVNGRSRGITRELPRHDRRARAVVLALDNASRSWLVDEAEHMTEREFMVLVERVLPGILDAQSLVREPRVPGPSSPTSSHASRTVELGCGSAHRHTGDHTASRKGGTLVAAHWRAVRGHGRRLPAGTRVGDGC